MIFCVEDDNSIRELVLYALKNSNIEAAGFERGSDMFAAMENVIPELILLDIMLPGEDGISILKKLKANVKTGAVPIIMVSAKDSEFDKVTALDLGADDYISKPFGMMELISRIKAVLRRSNTKEKQEYICGNVRLCINSHRVTVCDREITLTLKEFELLRLLMQNADRVLSRDTLLDRVWGYDFDGETRTLDVHIRTLRAKLGNDGDIIETVRGVGYRVGTAR